MTPIVLGQKHLVLSPFAFPDA